MESSAWKQYSIPQQLHFQPEEVFPSVLIFCYEDSLSTKIVKENKRKDKFIFFRFKESALILTETERSFCYKDCKSVQGKSSSEAEK